MPSTIAGRYATPDRESTPTGKNPPRCSICGERMKNHDADFCLRIGTFKDTVRVGPSAAVPVKLENHQEPSASQVNQRRVNVPASPTHQHVDKDNSIRLAASTRPNITTRYAPIMEMRTLLEIRGIHLSHFHITEDRDWAFVVSGNRSRMAKWASDSKQYLSDGPAVSHRRGCLCSTILAVVILTVIAGLMAFLLPLLELDPLQAL